MSNLIPKVIYQTWKTKDLDIKVQSVINNIQKINPEYKMILFDNNDIEEWIINTFKNDNIMYITYKKLKVGAAKADFWRYLILYINGGIYLDIDSNIIQSLDLLINTNDEAIISRQQHGPNDFVQWCLMFAPKHPILLRTINLCIYNINNKISHWLPTLTGPTVFTNAVNFVLKKKYNLETEISLFNFTDNDINNITNKEENVFCRFYLTDYENFCEYDNKCKDILLKNTIYWKNDKNIFNN